MKLTLMPLALTVALASTPAAAQVVVNSQTLGAKVIVTSTDDVIATYFNSIADNRNRLFLVGPDGVIFNNQTSDMGDTYNLGSYEVGTELVFRLFSDDHVRGIPDYNYFTGSADRNPDGIFHAAVSTLNGVTFVGFEDKFNGGDRDYNDLLFSVTNVNGGTVPEPATWAMMIAGFGLVGGALRNRRPVIAKVRFN